MNSLNHIRASLERIDPVSLPSFEAIPDLIKIFEAVQSVGPRLSNSEKAKISLLYKNLSTSHDLTNPALVKAFQAFRKILNKPSNILVKAFQAFRKILNKPLPSNVAQEAKQELSSWENSQDPNQKKAYRRINAILQDLEKAGKKLTLTTLDLSDLELATLPSILFTDPRFVDIDIKVNESKIRNLPASLTLGSLLNVRLYEQFPQSSPLTKLATMGDKGREGPLQHITDYLPFDTLAALSETSKTSLPLLQEYTSEIVINFLIIPATLQMKKLSLFLATLERFEGTWPSLTKLSIRNNSQLSDESLELIVKKCPNLQILNLYGCAEITDAGLQHLSLLANLQSLDLSACHQITGTGLAPLSALTNLQHLALRECRQITGTGLAPLSALTNLRHLDLGWSAQITDAELEPLSRLANLQILYLNYCDKITDAGLEPLSHLANLQHLNLSSCRQITDTGLAHLSALTNNLQILNLDWCDNITDAGLELLNNQRLQAGLRRVRHRRTLSLFI